jgi:hypothetical protein
MRLPTGQENGGFQSSRATDNWEMNVQGPKGFERSYVLAEAAENINPMR